VRTETHAEGFRAKAIAGTHTVMIALDCDEEKRKGLLGFAFHRTPAKDGSKWLRSLKVFESIVPHPKEARDPADPTKPARFTTLEFPVQGFLWSDYTALPDTDYTFTVHPMYGKPGALIKGPGLKLEVHTEKEFDGQTGIWFNRGAIASQAFHREFENTGPEPKDNPDPADPRTVWLSRGLLEACLNYIDTTPAGHGLRVAAYEFTYAPVLQALARALDRGVDVQIVYDDTNKAAGEAKGKNEAAIAAAKLPAHHAGTQILFARSKTQIPHNKFIVRLNKSGKPMAVWTGSTNFTPSGFLGQSNVGHQINDTDLAASYLQYWTILSTDPTKAAARQQVAALTPDPPTVVGPRSTTTVFSPRATDDLLNWYGDRIGDAVGSVAFTAAFGIAPTLVPALAADTDTLRFVLMEKPPPEDQKNELTVDRADIQISYGNVLGELYRFNEDGKPVARFGIADFELDKWFLSEDHFRQKNDGFVFFVHTKFLLIDPLSDDPLVCTGSANFSSNSLEQNDENMLLIRGDTRVADIYLTEFDRLFRHFYFRNTANELAGDGGEEKAAFLTEDDSWSESSFWRNGFKSRRRKLFFLHPDQTWADRAAHRAGNG
jgi:phosphatidylserine/phosphatidylglycerophosphate/cardiolipin synthase-like enzyme